MKLLVAVVAVSLSYPAYADNLVGIATLTHASETKYQPGSCESQPREPSDQGLVCIDFTYWMRYRLEDFTDLEVSVCLQPMQLWPRTCPVADDGWSFLKS